MMIEEVKQAFIFVLYMKSPEGNAIFIPASKNLTFDMLVKKIEKNPAVMTLQGKDGLNVIITRPADNISFVVEDKVEAVQNQLDKMKDAQAGKKIINPNFRFPTGKGRGR